MRKPEILSISSLAKTRIFEIEAVELQFSNGEHRTYERFKPSSRAAVMVLPIEDEHLFLVKEYAVGTERYELGFPKGLMDLGETPEQSAVRELKEEIGLGAKKLKHLRTLITSPSYMNNPMYIFIAQDLYPCQLIGDEPEPLQLVKIPLSEIETLLQDPNFNEARNLTALYMLRDFFSMK